MSRIVYVNGAYAAGGGGDDQRLRPRLPVRRRGLRGDQRARRQARRLRRPPARGCTARSASWRCRRRSATPRLEAIHRELVARNAVDRGHGLPAGDPRRRRPRLRLSGGPGAEPRPLHPGAGAGRHARGARRHPGDQPSPTSAGRGATSRPCSCSPPSMCKMMAKKAGKDDAWLVEDGFVTEGTSNNA